MQTLNSDIEQTHFNTETAAVPSALSSLICTDWWTLNAFWARRLRSFLVDGQFSL